MIRFIKDSLLSIAVTPAIFFSLSDYKRAMWVIWRLKKKWYIPIAVKLIILSIVVGITIDSNKDPITEKEPDTKSLDVEVKGVPIIKLPITKDVKKEEYKPIVENANSVVKDITDALPVTSNFIYIKGEGDCESHEKKITCKTDYYEGELIFNRIKSCFNNPVLDGVYVTEGDNLPKLQLPVIREGDNLFFGNRKPFTNKRELRETVESSLIAPCNISQKTNKKAVTEAVTEAVDNVDRAKIVRTREPSDSFYILTSQEQCSVRNDHDRCLDLFDFGVSIYNKVKNCFDDSSIHSIAVIPRSYKIKNDGYHSTQHLVPSIATPIIKYKNDLYLANGDLFLDGKHLSRLDFEHLMLSKCK